MSTNDLKPATLDSNVPQRYWNPYLAGLLLGATLLASFLTLGAGLGASAVLSRGGAYLESCVLPQHTAESPYFGEYFGPDKTANPMAYYLVFMFIGVLLGGFFSAMTANRLGWKIERGKNFPAFLRLILALVGGLLAGYASRLAGGCTSGQALTGGALLMNGSIVFMICVFAGGYATAWFVRRQWHD